MFDTIYDINIGVRMTIAWWQMPALLLLSLACKWLGYGYHTN